MTALADRALWYAARGWGVFPLAVRGKVPLTSSGFKDASKDPAVVSEWWRRWPEANIGIACGRVSGILVVDLDGPEGFETWIDLANENEVPLTLTSATGGGGWHLIFRADEKTPNSASKLGPKVDTRGDGGYIVAPPSIHPSGVAYRWHRLIEPAPAPGWLLGRLRPRAAPERVPTGPRPPALGATAYGRAALTNILDRFSEVGEGGRNDALNVAAFAVGQLVAGGELERGESVEALRRAAAEAGLGRSEIEATIDSGFGSGEGSPRSAPNTTTYRSTTSAPRSTVPRVRHPRLDERQAS